MVIDKCHWDYEYKSPLFPLLVQKNIFIVQISLVPRLDEPENETMCRCDLR